MRFILLIVTAVVIGFGSHTMAKDFCKQYNDYKLAGGCIKGYIASGIERRDIITNGNTCHLKGK